MFLALVQNMLVLDHSLSVPSSSSSSCSVPALHPCFFSHGVSKSSLHFNPILLKSNRCRVTCAAGDSKEDAARKALEQAFEGKKSLTKKWEEEIRKREVSEGGGGRGDGGGIGSGGGDGSGDGGGYGDMGEGDGADDPFDWAEFGEVSMATISLILFYLLIAHGPRNTLAFFRNIIRFVSRGFRVRKMPDDYQIPVRPKPPRPKAPEKKRLRNMSLV